MVKNQTYGRLATNQHLETQNVNALKKEQETADDEDLNSDAILCLKRHKMKYLL